MTDTTTTNDRYESDSATVCAWCEKVHENPVRLDPFSLGALARSMGGEAFGASCDLINQRAQGF